MVSTSTVILQICISVLLVLVSTLVVFFHAKAKRRDYGKRLRGIEVITKHEEPPIIDIIAVHGLGAHPELTWTVPDLAVQERDRRDVTSADSRSGLESAIPGRFNWLREYLPFDFPLARIMLFGHNAEWFMDAPTVSSHETARKLLHEITEKRAGVKNRRILFIGHSYGGIILKMALVQAKLSNKYKDIMDSTCGIVFLGTPHQGSNTAKFGKIIALLTSRVLGSKKMLLQGLQLHTTDLSNLQLDFYSACGTGIRITTVHETRDSKLYNIPIGMIVDRDSATLLGSELEFSTIAVDTDHSGLNKCTSKNNEHYKAVKKAVEEVMLLAEDDLKESRIMAACEQVGGEASIGSISHPLPPSTSSSMDRYRSSQSYRYWKASSTASQFLWFRGPPKSGKTTAATQVVKQLRNDNSLTDGADVVYFLCSKEPVTSARTVLRSVIAQLILRFPARATNPSYDKDALLKALTPTIHTELSILWMLLRQIIQAVSPRIIHWLIDGLDALPADELDQFVLELRSLWDAWNGSSGSQQIWLKVLVTSHPYAAIFKKSFTDLPHVAPDEEILAWFSSLGRAATNLRQDTVEEAQTYTADWIFKTQEYKEWRDSEYSDVLWLTGKAGSGKSTLMMKMLKDMQRKAKQPDLSSLLKNSTDVNLIRRTTTHSQAAQINNSAIVASYFYYYKDEYDHVRMLQSLLFQILKQHEGLFSVYYNTYTELTSEGAAKSFSRIDSVEPPSTWSFTHLREIFKALLNFQQYPIRIELFVDAVDESQESLEVIRIFHHLASQATRASKVIIKAVVTSRPMDDLPYRENEHRIAVEEHNTKDIERVIEKGITRISNKLDTFDEKAKALYDLPLLRNELKKRADGVILWISTVFKLIEYKLGTNLLAPADLSKTIDELPPTLTEMYKRMIEQLEYQLAQNMRETQRRLKWATFAQRTLHVREFLHAVALTKLGTETVTDDLARYCVPHSTAEAVRTTLTTSCCGFLELLMPCEGAPVSGKDFSKSEAGIQLFHRTVKEFLQTEKAKSFKVTEGPCVKMIVNVCIQYLRTSFLQVQPAGFGNGTLMSGWTANEYDIFVTYLEERLLIFYIFENLPAHLESLDVGQDEGRALELLSLVKENSTPIYPGEPILSLWMLQKFPRKKSVARRLLNRPMEGLLNTLTQTRDLQQNRDSLTSLLDAAVRSNKKIAVKILCAAGILAADNDHNAYSMAVETAAKDAHWDIVEYLDQVKWHNRRPEPAAATALARALVIACEFGHLAAAAMLLKKGANPESENNGHARPVHLAAMKGHEAIVDLLIQKGAECDARDKNGRTALWWAVESGHEAIAKLLLDSQASPDIEDNHGETPLLRAISRKDDVVIQLLRNAGADMTAVDDDATANDESYVPFFMVPFRRNDKFVGRESELQCLEEIQWDSSMEPVVVIVGMGGMGKTQLAVEYTYFTRDRDPTISVLWIDASSDAAFGRSYTQAYTQLQTQLSLTSSSRSDESITATVESVHRLLSSLTGHRWLIIWDNFDSEAQVVNMTTLRTCVPRSSKDRLIVTTRNGAFAEALPPRSVIRLKGLSLSAATEMLLNGPQLSLDRQNVWQVIVEELGALPVAIAQAAGYISHTKTSLEDYLSLLKGAKGKSLSPSNRVFDEGTSKTLGLAMSVANTFALSFDLLDSSAAGVLSLMSTLDCNGILEYLLLADQNSQSSLLKAINPLIQLSLVERVTIPSGRKGYSIHPLVQAAFRSRLKTAGELEVWEVKALEIMSKEFPRGDAFEHWDKCAELILHALTIIEGNAEVPDQESLLQRCQLSKECGAYLMATGAYTQAEKLIEEAYLSTIRVIQQDDGRTVSCLALLGKVLNLQGRYTEADEIIQRALSKAEEFLGSDHAETLRILDDRTLLLLNQGKYAEAEEMGMKARDRREMALAADSTNHPGTLTSMNNLAAIFRGQGRLQEATELGVRVLTSRQKLLGEHHPDTLSSKSNLVSIYRDQGRLDEAAALGGEVSHAMQEVLGENHPSTLMSMANLASVLVLQGKYEEAEKLLQQTLQLRERFLGNEHPHTLSSMDHLAAVLGQQGRYKEAEKLLRQTLQQQEKVLGLKHPDTLSSMNDLAVMLERQGRYKEAEEMHQESLKLRERVLGNEHPETLMSMSMLAEVYRDQGRLDEAVWLEMEAIRGMLQVLGAHHPVTAISREKLVWFYDNREQLSEAVRSEIENWNSQEEGRSIETS